MNTWDYSKISHSELLSNREELTLGTDKLLIIKDHVVEQLTQLIPRERLLEEFNYEQFGDFRIGIMNPDYMKKIVKNATNIDLIHPAQIDINIAQTGIGKGLHSHVYSEAVVQVLDENQGFSYEDDGFISGSSLAIKKEGDIYEIGRYKKQWSQLSPNDTWIFPRGYNHGIRSSVSGNMSFISVNSLAINSGLEGFPLDYIETK